ncbi:hypothetical protein AB7W40_21655 [Providencia rettgeri]
MNLENNYQSLLNYIFHGEKEIAIFVINGEHYYVIDNKDNFCIDVRPEYKLYIEKGWMKESLYNEAIANFRGGIYILDKSNFKDYINQNNVEVHSISWMRSFFKLNRSDNDLVEFYSYVEQFLSTLTEEVSDEWDKWKMRLPKFYINFDKKIYRHTDWERNHEKSAPSDWSAQPSNDFGLLVPDKYQYWLVDGMNFWKLQM